MCDPLTVGAIVGAVSTVAQGYAQKQQYEYQADVERYNARQQENEATRVRNIGVEEENKQRERVQQLLSRQRAQLGAANVDITSGSALQLQEDTLSLGEADALRVRSNYQSQAQVMEDQAALMRNRAGALDSAGANAFTGSLLSGAAGLAVGLGNTGVASKWFSSNSAAAQSVSGAIPLDLSKSMPNTFKSAGSLNLGFGR